MQAKALDADVFKDVYPQFYNFQTLLFVQLKAYFERLPSKGVNYFDGSGIRIFKVHQKDKQSINVYSKIIRTVKPEEISELVVYSLENGEQFKYEIIKKGSKIAATPDEDLLTFRFAPAREEVYQINIPNFNIHISYSKSADQSNSLFALGFMELYFKVETILRPEVAFLNYIIFFKNIKPTPQAILSVKATQISGEWADINFAHFASNGGELTPKQFFMALADGSMAFTQASMIMANSLQHSGFPKLD